MRTQSKRKALTLAVCAMLLVVATVFGTLAYLTDIQKTVNTFTVGNVDMDFDESDVDENGEPVTDENGNPVRTDEGNEYLLVPGSTYKKDPTFHVAANSEDTYLFVEIKNDIEAIEAPTTVADQLAENGWTAISENEDGTVLYVYGKSDTELTTVEKSDAPQDIVVFETFTINSDVDNATLKEYAGKTITLTAYAVQASGFETKSATEIFEEAFGTVAE